MIVADIGYIGGHHLLPTETSGHTLAVAHLVNNLIEVNCQEFAAPWVVYKLPFLILVLFGLKNLKVSDSVAVAVVCAKSEKDRKWMRKKMRLKGVKIKHLFISREENVANFSTYTH